MAQMDELPAPPKKKSKANWFILLLLLLMLGGGGFVVWKMGFVDKFLGGEETAQTDTTSGGSGSGSTKIGAGGASNLKTATFAPFVANLSDPMGSRYIRMTLDVEVVSPEIIRELEMQNPRIRDAMIMLLSSKSYGELSTQAGKLQLKNEILDRINQVLGGPKVTRVFFTELVVQ